MHERRLFKHWGRIGSPACRNSERIGPARPLPASNVSLSLRVPRQKATTILGIRPRKIRESLSLAS
eukprot:7945697-Pyramimonas_sp.AAC.1